MGFPCAYRAADDIGREFVDDLRFLRVPETPGRGSRFIDAEHFFDGYKNNPEYALAALRKAQDAGADWIVLCDTNGGTLPAEISEIVSRSRRSRSDAPIGIHTHNDCELAVANTLAAVQAGARQVQGTINGYGERCGNANLCSIIPNLQLKMDYRCISDDQLQSLTKRRAISAKSRTCTCRLPSHTSAMPHSPTKAASMSPRS